MKYAVLFLAAVVILPLAACKTTVKDDEVTVQTTGYGNGNFCPPGQAKKGNC